MGSNKTRKALSIRQPWASLLAMGLKTVELRSWSTDYRGPVLIHAASKIDSAAVKRLHLPNLPLGCFIGEANLVKVEPMTPALWDALADSHLQHGAYPGRLYAWHFDHARELRPAITSMGSLGLFTVNVETGNVEGGQLIDEELNTLN